MRSREACAQPDRHILIRQMLHQTHRQPHPILNAGDHKMPHIRSGMRSIRAMALVVAMVSLSIAHADSFSYQPPIAITNATILRPGEPRIDGGTILIENGRIVDYGLDVTIPENAELLDASGLYAYPGFISAHAYLGIPDAPRDEEERKRFEDENPDPKQRAITQTRLANRRGINPQFRSEEHFAPKKEDLDAFRKAGFTTAIAAPRHGIFGGTSAAFDLSGAPLRRTILATDLGQHASFRTGEPGKYPGSILGVFAQFRQVMLDTQWAIEEGRFYGRHPNKAARPPHDPAYAPLRRVLFGETPLIFQANAEHAIHRAINLAKEFDARVMVSGAKNAYKLTERIKQEHIPLIVSLKFDDEPEYGKKKKADPATKKSKNKEKSKNKDTPQSESQPSESEPGSNTSDSKDTPRIYEPLKLRKERRRLWEEQVTNVIRLHEAGIPFALSTHEFKTPDAFLKSLRLVIERGLPEEAAVRALTTVPADMFDLDNQIGSITPGRLANMSLFTKPISDKKAKVRYTFVDGRKFEYNQNDDDTKDKDADDTDEDGNDDDDIDEDGIDEGYAGAGDTDEGDTDEEDTDEEDADDTGGEPGDPDHADIVDAGSPGDDETGNLDTTGDDGPTWRCEILADRKITVQTGGNVFIRNATVIPVSSPTMKNTSILVEDGKIAAIGAGLTPPPDTHIIDATGLYVMPGMIDAHSHMAIDGINEGTLSVTAEVRIADLVRNDSVGLYRALAGGTTTAHTMHGSSNPIGGQNVVFKFKYLHPVDEMMVHDAPRSMKWALGENVKQSNWTNAFGKRFPNGRMGVEAVIRDALLSGRQYENAWAKYRTQLAAGEDVLQPRRDLRREAMADVLKGDIWVHTHCYRSDEIMRLIHTAEDFGIRIAVLQHVLEGYRIAPEIARHGASASTFSNFWAYKIEAYVAIPHNAAMMTRHGINVSINSDSANTIRYLNLEAAKSMKWGRLGEIETLRLVTLNPAIQLGIDHRVGSIELGKDADLAIFNGHPLNAYAKNLYTFIEGELYFEHPELSQLPQLPGHRPVVPAPALDWTKSADRSIPTSPSRLYAIVGGTVHPISRPPIERGTVIIRNGTIESVGTDINIPPDAGVINATGLHVYPGLIDGGGTLGLREIGSLRATRDNFDIATFAPELKTASAIHPHSAHIQIARTSGITTQLATPSGGLISGQSTLIQLDGWTADDMILDEAVAIHLSVPSLPVHLNGDAEAKKKRKKEHKEQMRSLGEFLTLAKNYANAKRAGETNPDLSPRTDLRLEAMIPYNSGAKSIIVASHDYKHMLDVIDFAEKHDFNLILSGATQSWKIADILAEKDIPVILSRVTSMPGRFEPWDSVYQCAAALEKAGVKWCFASSSAENAYDLSINAGLAVAHGLPPERAIYALTLGAAEILGIDDRLGSLEPGKIADIIVTTHEPMQTASQVTHMFIRGNPLGLTSMHTQSYETFRNRPEPDLPPQKELVGPPSFTRQP